MGLAQSALILLGIGIISERFGAGFGLEQLGVGIKTLAAAPLGGMGLGLGEFGGGLRTFAESLGDIGRGFGEMFKYIPKLPPPSGQVGPDPGQTLLPSNGNGLITVSGGDRTTQLAGGGGSTPTAPPPPPPSLPKITTPTYVRPTLRPISLTDDRLRNIVML